jgi:hypothetical protein
VPFEIEPDLLECIVKLRIASSEGRAGDSVLSKLSWRPGPVFVLEVDACLRERRYDGRWGLAAPFCVFVQLAEAGNLGGGMLSYLLKFSVALVGSVTFDSLRFRLSFLRIADVEKTESLSLVFSTGLGTNATLSACFGVTEKLGARGPFGRGCAGFLFISDTKFGLM